MNFREIAFFLSFSTELGHLIAMDVLFELGDRLLRVISGTEGEGSAVDVSSSDDGSAVHGTPASALDDGSYDGDQIVCPSISETSIQSHVTK